MFGLYSTCSLPVCIIKHQISKFEVFRQYPETSSLYDKHQTSTTRSMIAANLMSIAPHMFTLEYRPHTLALSMLTSWGILPPILVFLNSSLWCLVVEGCKTGLALPAQVMICCIIRGSKFCPLSNFASSFPQLYQLSVGC